MSSLRFLNKQRFRMSDKSEEEVYVRELKGDHLTPKEIAVALSMGGTVAASPAEVKLNVLRYLFRSDGERILFIGFVIFALIAWGLSFVAWWAALVPTILAGILLLLVLLLLRVAKTKYQYGLLTPAIVTSTNPISLLSLANMSQGDHSEEAPIETHFAIKQNNSWSKKVDGLTIGSIIPCVSTFTEGASDDCWEDFDPSPLEFGTGDKAILADRKTRLDAEDVMLLRTLQAAGRLPEVNQPAILLEDFYRQGTSSPPELPG